MGQKKEGMRGSQRLYKVKPEYNVYVKMRDGVRVCVDIYRPDNECKFPALLGMSAYGKRAQVRLWDKTIVGEAGDPGTPHSTGDMQYRFPATHVY
jgi:predicted acyl esterase